MTLLREQMLQDMTKLRNAHLEEVGILEGRADTGELERLRRENGALKEENQLQAAHILDLEKRITDSLRELSEKEAAWCGVEERLRQELQKTWGERYQAWMLATEQKIEELRRTNEFLKTALKQQEDEGPS